MATLNHYQVRHWRCKEQKSRKQLRSSIACWDKKSIKTVRVCTLLSLATRARDGAAVRAIFSHQCGPGSNPGVDAICGLNLLLVLSLTTKVFLRCSGFPRSSKTKFPNSNYIRNQVDKEPLCGFATFKSLLLFFLSIYLLRGFLIILCFQYAFPVGKLCHFFSNGQYQCAIRRVSQ